MFTRKKKIFIPIGSSCSVASYLRHIGYRREAFPFDWTVTPIDSAINLINNDFEDFFEKKNLVFLEPTNRLLFRENGIDVEVSEEIITPVYDKEHHILYVHDFSKNAKEEYDMVKEKYSKRVNRLKEVYNNENINITFIFDNTKPNDWQQEQYANANYEFKELLISDLKNINIQRKNINIISLKDFKKNTFILKLYKSISKKLRLNNAK